MSPQPLDLTVPFLDLRPQYHAVRADIDRAVAEVVASQQFILGDVVERFEAAVARRLDCRHAVGCGSGTDALHLTLRALDLKPGDEVVVPAFTFFATAGAVWNAGLRPVFADIDAATFNVTADSVEPVLTERTRAIIAVHLFGRMADMAALRRLSDRHGLALIEDAAQAFGARQRIEGKWRDAGTVGLAGCLSFFPTKNLGGFGDGGMVVTDDDAVAERVRKLRVHGGAQMCHDAVGTNSRLDAIQAAVLLTKLPHIDRWIRERRASATAYDAALERLGVHLRVRREADGNYHTYNQYTVRDHRRDALRKYLKRRGVGTAVYYPRPLHVQPCFADLGYRHGDRPEAERAATEVLSLPIFPGLTRNHREVVIDGIRDFYRADG